MPTDRRLAAVLLIAVAACENSPFEPQGLGERVPLGQKITDEVGGDTVAQYSFVGRDSALYAIFFEAVRVVPFCSSAIRSIPSAASD